MAHPYKSAAHKNDPKWVGNLNKYVVPAATDNDAKAVKRNYGGDAATTRKAAYSPPAQGEDD
jgi:hypothetical protein